MPIGPAVTKQTLDADLKLAAQTVMAVLLDPGGVVQRANRFVATHNQAALQALPSSDGTPTYTTDEAYAIGLFGNQLAALIAYVQSGTASAAQTTTFASLAAQFDPF
jgi:hypothetical protein